MQAGATIARRFALIAPVPYDLPGVSRFQATDTRLGTPVLVDIVSTIAPTAVRDAAARASQVRDRRLTRILSTGMLRDGQDSITYVVSEDLPGLSLSDLIGERILSESLASALLGSTTQALQAAAMRGEHHGMVRSSAITVTDRGRLVLSGLGLDGELATQAGLGLGRSEHADAVAVAQLFVTAVTGRAADEAESGDLPLRLSEGARALSMAVIDGTGPHTLAEVMVALSPFNTRALSGLAALAPTLPLGPDALLRQDTAARVAEAEAEAAAEADALVDYAVDPEHSPLEVDAPLGHAEALAAAPTQPAPASAESLADASIAAALDSAIDAPGADDSLVEDAQLIARALAEGRLDEDTVAMLSDDELAVFEQIADEQNAENLPSIWEAFLERLHRRFPRSEGVTQALERAHARAERVGRLRGEPLLVIVGAILVVVVSIAAFSLMTTPIDPSFERYNNPSATYPAFTISPEPTVSPSAE